MKHRYALLIIWLLIALTSCTPSLEEALRVATKTETNAKVAQQEIHNKFPVIPASFCAITYPPKTSTETETEVVKGNTEQLKSDLARASVEIDSLQNALKSLVIKPECEPEVLARDRVINHLNARLKELTNKAENLQADLQKITTTRTEVNSAEVEKYKLLYESEKSLREAAQADNKDLKTQIIEVTGERNKAYWFGGIKMLLLAGLFILFLRK